MTLISLPGWPHSTRSNCTGDQATETAVVLRENSVGSKWNCLWAFCGLVLFVVLKVYPYECFAYLYVCTLHVCLMPLETKREYWFPGNGGIGCCEPPCECWEPNLDESSARAVFNHNCLSSCGFCFAFPWFNFKVLWRPLLLNKYFPGVPWAGLSWRLFSNRYLCEVAQPL